MHWIGEMLGLRAGTMSALIGVVSGYLLITLVLEFSRQRANRATALRSADVWLAFLRELDASESDTRFLKRVRYCVNDITDRVRRRQLEQFESFAMTLSASLKSARAMTLAISWLPYSIG